MVKAHFCLTSVLIDKTFTVNHVFTNVTLRMNLINVVLHYMHVVTAFSSCTFVLVIKSLIMYPGHISWGDNTINDIHYLGSQHHQFCNVTNVLLLFYVLATVV